MAALASTTPTRAGVAWSPAAVSASDTISQTQLGVNGAWLVIINGGGSSDTVTVGDAGLTPAGTAAAAYTNPVANGTSEIMYLSPKLIDPNVGTLTVTHSFTTSVTYVLLPLG